MKVFYRLLSLKICCVLILFLIFSCRKRTNSQATPEKVDYRLMKLHYENANGEKGVTTFDYNENGNLNVAVWELLDGSRSSINFYTYDDNGNLIKKYREFSDSLFSSQIFEYDDKGNLITEHFERSDGVKGVTNYEYDERGHQVKANCKGLNGWFHGIISYTYDEKGRKIRGDIKQQGKNTGTISYSSDEKGNLSKEHWDFSEQWSQTFQYEYGRYEPKSSKSYTSANVFITNPDYRVIGENYDFSNKTGGPSEYEYNKNGKLVKKVFKRSDGLTTETSYLYDNQKRLIKSYRKYSNGRTAIFNYFYNVDSKLREKSFKRSDGVVGSETYEYDETGRLISAIYDNMDCWLTGTITFSYDKIGNLTNGYYKGKDGLNAEISFINDENKNVIKILWDFSNDMTQTYVFEYEKIISHFQTSGMNYFDQKPPGLSAKGFATGLISTETYSETGCTFAPDGTEFYFTRSGGDLPSPTTFVCRFQNNNWSHPQKAPFVGFGSHISPDGKKMFISKFGYTKDNQRTIELWIMNKEEGTWGNPQYHGLGSRASMSNYFNLYYIKRSNEEDKGVIAVQKFVNKQYLEPEVPAGGVNTQFYEAHPYIAKDESYIIFDSNRPDGYGKGDLYISFRNDDDTWGEAINLGAKINTQHYEGYASLSPDGKYLFYSSNKNGSFDLYWINATIIEKFRDME